MGSHSPQGLPIWKPTAPEHGRQMWAALSGHRGSVVSLPFLAGSPNPSRVQPVWTLAPRPCTWGGQARGSRLRSTDHPPWPALAPVLVDHGARVPEGQLLRLQHAALLLAHRLWLRRLLRQWLRVAGPVHHGPDPGAVPTHREAQGGRRGSTGTALTVAPPPSVTTEFVFPLTCDFSDCGVSTHTAQVPTPAASLPL